MEGMAGAITKWLPTQFTGVKIQWGDETTATVGTVGEVKSRELRDGAGKPTTVQGAPAMAIFQLDSMDVAHTAGTRWSDSQMRQWQGSSGTKGAINWRG